jgi:hypothetical protein
MAYLLSRELKGSHRKFSGHVTVDEFIRSIAEVHNDPEFDRMRYSISDFLDVQSFTVDARAVTMAVAYGLGAAFTNSRMKLAVVAADPKVLELVEIYGKSVPYSLRVFSNIRDARNWTDAEA